MNQNKPNPLYFIAILPPTYIIREIKAFKEMIRRDHDVKHALKLPAHITLQIPFRISENQEPLLKKKLKTFSEIITPFQIELDGFGRFSKNVIFVKIRDHEPFVSIHSDLQDMLRSFIDLKSHEISSKIHPHITIAVRDLKRSNFPPIWNDFEIKAYKNSFTANNLVLLKHNGKTWDVLKKFQFSS